MISLTHKTKFPFVNVVFVAAYFTRLFQSLVIETINRATLCRLDLPLAEIAQNPSSTVDSITATVWRIQ